MKWTGIPKFAFLILVINSCTHDAKHVENAEVSGDYTISYFYDSGDKTASFNGYRFEFAPNRVFLVKSGSQNLTGKWTETNDEIEIELDTSDRLLKELDEDWKKESKTAKLIKLRDGDKLVYFAKL